MQYLSQGVLPMVAALRAGLKDGYAWHKEIWKAFPGRPDATRDFLFRVDQRDCVCHVLLLSETSPSTTGLLSWQTKAIAEGFLDHKVYRFKLKANPTFRRCSDKRRLAIYKEHDLRTWMIAKLKAAGAKLETDALAVSAPIDEFFDNGQCGHHERKKHVAVDFEGILRVRDSTLFINAFHKGIGSAKGFGYGLLMLQPVRD